MSDTATTAEDVAKDATTDASVTATALTTTAEKQAQAEKNIALIKQWIKDGEVTDGEKAAEMTKMMADAQKLGAEVRADKADKRADELKALAESVQKGVDFGSTEQVKAVAGQAADLLGGTTQDGVEWMKQFAPKEQIGASAKVAGLLGFQSQAKSASFHPDVQKQIATKALAEGTNGAGGYLVVPTYLQSLFAETRRQGNVLRRMGLLTEHPVESNLVYIPRGSGAATVGIVAENGTKPSQDQSYAQTAVNIYTWAGISKVSNQLLQDSSPTAADLVGRELGTLLGNLEEQKILNGSGTGEPKGILSAASEITEGSGVTAQDIIDDIITMIYTVQANYFAPPNAIVMHPRRLAFIQKGKDTATNYLFNANGAFRAPGGLID